MTTLPRTILLVATLVYSSAAFSQKQKVWLDTDTGNETDDVYAIVRLLNDTSIDVVGISSAHFNNADLVAFQKWNQYDTKGINTVEISQRLNEEILALLGKTNIDHPLGADRQTGRAWGGMEPRNSTAAQSLIKTVKSLAPKQKLTVICIGALTNIASAVLLDTSIASHIKCYLLGAKYNTEKRYWDKSEFNIRNDLNAFDYILNNTSLDITIMPTSAALPFKFKRDELYAAFGNEIPVLKYLKQRWVDTNPDDMERTLWDVALIEAFLHPSTATLATVITPPENVRRRIKVYTKINVAQMKRNYFNSIEKVKKGR
jgi:purine nucleosidase